MSYIPRAAERKFLRMSGFFKAVLVTGARQVGKTTMLRHLAAGSSRSYVSMDDADERELARSDPKLYFCDTGLCANLSMWLTEETLQVGAASGHYFENYVVMELVKRFSYASSNARLSYYRDSNKKEIDLVVEEDGLLHPLEIKKGASPSKQEVNKFSVLDKATLQRSSGGIVCLADKPLPIDKQNSYIPCWLL
ncbi:MAG: DUF4143 domain-containing protein [Selenomonadaceae bacterium]|nr:DUF4143 domain-containing protein [Selenomonadaceae bacterium]